MSENLTADMSGILNDLAAEFKTAEVFNSWTPPIGDYTALITDFKSGISTSEAKGKMAWWRLEMRLLDAGNPELDQKDFSLGFFSRNLGFPKAAMSVLAGRRVDDIHQLPVIFEASKGAIVKLNVVMSSNKKNKNITITELVEAAPAAAPATA